MQTKADPTLGKIAQYLLRIAGLKEFNIDGDYSQKCLFVVKCNDEIIARMFVDGKIWISTSRHAQVVFDHVFAKLGFTQRESIREGHETEPKNVFNIFLSRLVPEGFQLEMQDPVYRVIRTHALQPMLTIKPESLTYYYNLDRDGKFATTPIKEMAVKLEEFGFTNKFPSK